MEKIRAKFNRNKFSKPSPASLRPGAQMLRCRSPSTDSFTYDLEIPRRMHKSLATREWEPGCFRLRYDIMQSDSNRNCISRSNVGVVCAAWLQLDFLWFRLVSMAYGVALWISNCESIATRNSHDDPKRTSFDFQINLREFPSRTMPPDISIHVFCEADDLSMACITGAVVDFHFSTRRSECAASELHFRPQEFCDK